MSDLKSEIDDLRVEITLCHFHGLLIRNKPTLVHILLLRRYNTHGEAYLKEPVHFRFNYRSILYFHPWISSGKMFTISYRSWNPSPVFPMLSSTVVPVLPIPVVPVLLTPVVPVVPSH